MCARISTPRERWRSSSLRRCGREGTEPRRAGLLRTVGKSSELLLTFGMAVFAPNMSALFDRVATSTVRIPSVLYMLSSSDDSATGARAFAISSGYRTRLQPTVSVSSTANALTSEITERRDVAKDGLRYPSITTDLRSRHRI